MQNSVEILFDIRGGHLGDPERSSMNIRLLVLRPTSRIDLDMEAKREI